ncbi:MAG: RyR domain-containing protein, partial [Methanobacterium sp.]
EDTFYMIRRALFLRSMIERKAKNILNKKEEANIDESVLRAFLKVPKYKHGVRSMGAIFEMSMLTDKKKFEQSALPPQEQLDMHVDAEIFSKLVSRDVLLDSKMDELAQEIHKEFIRTSKKPKSSKSMQPWDLLDEKYKNANIEQAQQIPEKLQVFHYDFMPAIGEIKGDFEFTDEQVEVLAEMEHERFNEQKFREGWTLDRDAEDSDANKKISPWLIDWDELPDNIKEYDRIAVRNIPTLLNRVGFEIYSLK